MHLSKKRGVSLAGRCFILAGFCAATAGFVIWLKRISPYLHLNLDSALLTSLNYAVALGWIGVFFIALVTMIVATCWGAVALLLHRGRS
jgi:hypothetical protein